MTVSAFSERHAVSINDGSEHDLSTINIVGVFDGWIDLTALAGASVTLRTYVMINSSGSAIKYQETVVSAVSPPPPLWRFPTIANPFAVSGAIRYTYQKTSGSTFSADMLTTQDA